MFRKKGQVSIMMIMLLIVTLFFYGMSFGWRNTAKAKVQVSNAAMLGAAYISSMYTSYAWMMSNVYLEGRTYKKKCQKNWGMIIAVAAVVASVFAPYGYAFLAVGAMSTPMAIGYDRGASAIVNGWNLQMQDTGNPGSDWKSGGEATAFQNVVDDGDMVYDVADDDGDGNYCDMTQPLSVRKRDCPKVARPSYYLNHRSRNFATALPSDAKFRDMQASIQEVGEILGIASYQNFDDAITKQACAQAPEKCNSCCVSIEDRLPSCPQSEATVCLADDIVTYDPMLSSKWNLYSPAGVFGTTDLNTRFKKETINDPSSALVLDPTNIDRAHDFEGVVYPLMALLTDTNIQVNDLTLTQAKGNKKHTLWCDATALGKTYTDIACSTGEAKIGLLKQGPCFWGGTPQLQQDYCMGASCCVNRFLQWNGTEYIQSNDLWIDKVGATLSQKIEEIKNITVKVGNQSENFISWMPMALVLAAEWMHALWTLPEGRSAVLVSAEQQVKELTQVLSGMQSGLQQVRQRTQSILHQTHTDAQSWCVPPNTSSVSASEQRAILADGATWGSLESVVNCLAYNVENQTKFDMCLNSCSEFCQDLPRSLVQGFNPNQGQDCSANSSYLQNIQRSSFLAKDQVKKFQQRWQYLKYILDAVRFMDYATANASLLSIKVNAFQLNWQETLANQKKPVDGGGSSGSGQVYGWMGPSGAGEKRGYWHVVGVSGSGTCLGEQAAGREPWIRMRKKKKHMGLKICLYYYLEGTANKASMTAWRWDEDLNAFDRLFRGDFNRQLGNDLLRHCVSPADKKLWCPEGIDYNKGACIGEEDPFWRPAFVGSCGVVGQLQPRIKASKSVSAGGGEDAKAVFDNGPWPPIFSW